MIVKLEVSLEFSIREIISLFLDYNFQLLLLHYPNYSRNTVLGKLGSPIHSAHLQLIELISYANKKFKLIL